MTSDQSDRQCESRRDAHCADEQELLAGEFSSWLASMRDNLRKQAGVSVPCGECTACCRSSQFVHIEPDETSTLARIPKELLVRAPGKPEGTLVMGYDRNGHCPMLINNRCSIYEDRPRTCRNYDCRVFAATRLKPSEDEKELITRQTERWRFSYQTEGDQLKHAAVEAAARFLREHASDFPRALPGNSPQIALLAIKVYQVFLRAAELEKTGHRTSDCEIVRQVIEAIRQFDAK